MAPHTDEARFLRGKGIWSVHNCRRLQYWARGRALFGTHERPKRLLGKIVKFLNAEGLEQAACPPQGRVESFKDSAYKIVFESDFTYGEKKEQYVLVVPHSKGWPVSGALKRPTAVLAKLESGHRFWADIMVIEKETIPNRTLRQRLRRAYWSNIFGALWFSSLLLAVLVFLLLRPLNKERQPECAERDDRSARNKQRLTAV